MMTKQFKVGDKVRIKDVSKIAGAHAFFKDGDTTHVMDVDSDGCLYLYCNDGDCDTGLYVINSEFSGLEPLPNKPSNSERITALETQVAELQAELQALKKRKKPKHLLSHYPTPNEQRKAVIERAKAFVAEVSERAKGDDSNDIGNVIYRHRTTRPEFHVNAKKRTVVVLLKGAHNPVLIGKAIAKCAPDDVFNADIGKAIALGRALGLDVSEFVNTPKPTEVVVGMRVNRFNKFGNNLGELAVWKVRILSEGESGPNTHNLNNGNCYCENYGDHITDDTDAKY